MGSLNTGADIVRAGVGIGAPGREKKATRPIEFRNSRRIACEARDRFRRARKAAYGMKLDWGFAFCKVRLASRFYLTVYLMQRTSGRRRRGVCARIRQAL